MAFRSRFKVLLDKEFLISKVEQSSAVSEIASSTSLGLHTREVAELNCERF